MFETPHQPIGRTVPRKTARMEDWTLDRGTRGERVRGTPRVVKRNFLPSTPSSKGTPRTEDGPP